MGKTKDVRAAVEAELSFDPLVDTGDVAVRNIAGDVTLTGTVPSYPQYLEAAVAARRVAGVTNVHNHLAVQLPDGDYRDDVQLTTAVNNALAQNITVPGEVEATAMDPRVPGQRLRKFQVTARMTAGPYPALTNDRDRTSRRRSPPRSVPATSTRRLPAGTCWTRQWSRSNARPMSHQLRPKPPGRSSDATPSS